MQAPTRCAAYNSPAASSAGMPIAAAPQSPTRQARAFPSSVSFIRSWPATRPGVIATRYWARRYAESSNTPRSDHCRRTLPHRRRFASTHAARQDCSAGGCADSGGQTRSSTRRRMRRSPNRTSYAGRTHPAERCFLIEPAITAADTRNPATAARRCARRRPRLRRRSPATDPSG